MEPTLDYLYGLKRFGMKLGLEEIRNLLKTLGNPEEQFKSIHIAGTNGKGSVSAYLAAILQEAGYKVGWYTSPHLIKFNERIRVNGKEISDLELVRLTKIIKGKSAELEPTFFEFTTALAFLYFAEQKVDFAVVETGLGGRLDATNVLNPVVSVITTISFDHQKHLGNSLAEIAYEKACIIKENGRAVIGRGNKEVLDVLEKKCADKNAKLIIATEENIKTPLLGKHQQENANTAITVARLLKINEEEIKQGIAKAKWPGRLEFVSENVLIDCAHNVAGMEKLVEFVKRLGKRKVLVLGMAEDKEIAKMVRLIVPLFENVIITQGNHKPASMEVIADEVLKYVKDVKKIRNVEEAMKMALNSVSEDELVLITGSIYLVGDVLKVLKDTS
ncbi:MAG: bifunctional folylpolyglutamate synthase/dihydrofolate synthase [Nanoarchaeota archaeon]|nr:bifunctional folylpolyglutamate synthase/dihydrofolate synthase [Nanoarchaeota archaeon]